MDIKTTSSMHPLTAVAAVSVTLFSLAGIGAITGLIPTSHSQPALVQPATPAMEPLKSAAATPPAEVSKVATAAETAAKPAVHKPAVKHTKPAEKAVATAEAPVTVAQNLPPAGYGPPPGYAPPPAVEPPKAICHDCGVIESVREVEKIGQGSGVGAVAGGVAGGLLGHQTGGGRGKDVMTVLGAIGGAVAGNAIEKNVKKVKSYEIAIRFEDGTSRVLTQDNPPAWRSGDKVKLVNGAITASNS